MNPKLFWLITVIFLALFHPAEGQQPAKVQRIGVLLPWSPTSEVSVSFLKAFGTGLRELGYVENRDLVIEHRYGDGVLERLPDKAAELVRSQVDVIVTSAGPPALAVKQTTKTIPIIFTQVSDPVAEGLIASLARPGGNLTGLSQTGSDLAGAAQRSFPKNLPCSSLLAIRFSKRSCSIKRDKTRSPGARSPSSFSGSAEA